MLGAGALKKAIEVRKHFFIDIRSAFKTRLSKGLFLAKAKSLFGEYCEQQRKQGVEPEKLTFSYR